MSHIFHFISLFFPSGFTWSANHNLDFLFFFSSLSSVRCSKPECFLVRFQVFLQCLLLVRFLLHLLGLFFPLPQSFRCHLHYYVYFWAAIFLTFHSHCIYFFLVHLLWSAYRDLCIIYISLSFPSVPQRNRYPRAMSVMSVCPGSYHNAHRRYKHHYKYIISSTES